MLSFQSARGEELKGSLVVASGTAGTKAPPVVVLAHGGH